VSREMNHTCLYLGGHSYTAWEDLDLVNQFITQERHCNRCGRKEYLVPANSGFYEQQLDYLKGSRMRSILGNSITDLVWANKNNKRENK